MKSPAAQFEPNFTESQFYCFVMDNELRRTLLEIGLGEEGIQGLSQRCNVRSAQDLASVGLQMLRLLDPSTGAGLAPAQALSLHILAKVVAASRDLCAGSCF